MIDGANGGPSTDAACARCGNPVSQATSYLTEVGLLCWPCFGKFQSQEDVAERRDAYAETFPLADNGSTRRPSVGGQRRRWPLLVAAMLALACAGTAAYVLRRPRSLPDPALALMRTTLPRWQLARARSLSHAEGPGGALVVSARPWPALAAAFDVLDRVWPEEAPVRAAVESANRALADAGLPYLASVWMVNDRPYVLSHALVARVSWHIGARAIGVLRLRRLDDIGIDFAFDGVTQGGLPVVMLDRVEATLTKDLPVMYAAAREVRSTDYNDFDHAALARVRSFLEGRLGPGFARAVLALRERDRLLEEMRTRFHGDEIKLAVPERFVLGDDWLDELKPSTRLDRPRGPLFLDTDLKALAQADRALRDPVTAEAFRGAIDAIALTTEAHEARHAAEASDRAAPPPPALFEVMPQSSTRMIGWADSELQAFLGEVHDAPLPACVNLGRIMRTVHGRFARREPHYYATLALLKQLGVDLEKDPAQQLAALCAIPDGELRTSAAAIWQRLYGAPMPAGERMVPGAPTMADR
jgi:hypothetical protein